MSDQDQPGRTPWGENPAGATPAPPPPPPPPPPPASYPSYPSYPSGHPVSYAAQPSDPAYGYSGPAIPYAHWGLRVGAGVLDALLVIPGYFLASIGSAMSGSIDNGTQSVGILLMVIGYVGAIGFGLWNQIARQGRTGCSLGKEWMDIRLVRETTGQPLGGWLTFGRSLLHLLDMLPCYLGYLWPLWDAKRQTFADKLVGSVVIRQPQGAPH